MKILKKPRYPQDPKKFNDKFREKLIESRKAGEEGSFDNIPMLDPLSGSYDDLMFKRYHAQGIIESWIHDDARMHFISDELCKEIISGMVKESDFHKAHTWILTQDMREILDREIAREYVSQLCGLEANRRK